VYLSTRTKIKARICSSIRRHYHCRFYKSIRHCRPITAHVDELKYFGVSNTSLGRFKSCTINSRQSVKVFGVDGRVVEVPSGVPRGGRSRSSALLINFFTQRLSKTKYILLADDNKIFHRIKSPTGSAVPQDGLNLFSARITDLGFA